MSLPNPSSSVRVLHLIACLLCLTPAQAAPPNTPPDPLIPPTSVEAITVSQTEISIIWQDTNQGDIRYLIERSSDGKKFRKIAETEIGAREYLDTKLPPGTPYAYRVSALRNKDRSPPSEPASTITIPAPPPAGKSEVQARRINDTQIEVSWKHSGERVEIYEVLLFINGGNWDHQQISHDKNSTTFNISDPHDDIDILVRAANNGGTTPIHKTAVHLPGIPLPPWEGKGLWDPSSLTVVSQTTRSAILHYRCPTEVTATLYLRRNEQGPFIPLQPQAPGSIGNHRVKIPLEPDSHYEVQLIVERGDKKETLQARVRTGPPGAEESDDPDYPLETRPIELKP